MTLRAPVIPADPIALFLDVDGTLLDIAPSPHDVHVPESLPQVLQLAFKNLSGAMALISGRSIQSLDALFAPCVFPAAGQHGLERRDIHGHIDKPQIDPSILDTIRHNLLELQATHPGLLLEDKGSALAFHYRGALAFEPMVRATVYEQVEPISDQFQIVPGKCVFEIIPRGFSKRTAIEAFMRESPFKGNVPVFFGDDLTDEEGFRAVNDLQGVSVQIGTTQSTDACYQLATVHSVISWLRELNQKLRP